MASEVVGRLLRRIGDARREQPVGDGLRVHVGEAACVEIMDQSLLERLHELGQRTLLGLDDECCIDAITNVAGKLRKPDREFLRGGDDLAVAQGKGGAPADAPVFRVGVVVGPGEVLGQLPGDCVQMEGRVEIVPAEHLEGWQIVTVLHPREVGKADLALVSLAVVGDKEQVVRGPGGALGVVGGSALL